jgi:3-hydroxybutyrate dehydrogenase
VVCTSVRTPLVDKQIPERNVILKETVDGEFTTLEDVAETASRVVRFHRLTGPRVVVSHGWHMQ